MVREPSRTTKVKLSESYLNLVEFNRKFHKNRKPHLCREKKRSCLSLSCLVCVWDVDYYHRLVFMQSTILTQIHNCWLFLESFVYLTELYFTSSSPFLPYNGQYWVQTTDENSELMSLKIVLNHLPHLTLSLLLNIRLNILQLRN